MKRIITVILSLAMIFLLPAQAAAVQEQAVPTVMTLQKNGYSVKVTESVDALHRITRTYTKSETAAFSAVDFEQTRAVLLALKLDEDTVDRMTEVELIKFAASKSITVTTSYTKRDVSGNVIHLQEDAAIAQASVIEQAQLQAAGQAAQGMNARDSEADTYWDEYMRLSIAASDMGNGDYWMYAAAGWLTMPAFRGVDSLGIMAHDIRILPGTWSGTKYYTKRTVGYGIDEESSQTVEIESTDFGRVNNGNWQGVAARVRLPGNISEGGMSIIYSNFSATMNFDVQVVNPDLRVNFNAASAYSHAYVSLGLNPELSISFDGDFQCGATIGLSPTSNVEIRQVEIAISYVPA